MQYQSQLEYITIAFYVSAFFGVWAVWETVNQRKVKQDRLREKTEKDAALSQQKIKIIELSNFTEDQAVIAISERLDAHKVECVDYLDEIEAIKAAKNDAISNVGRAIIRLDLKQIFRQIDSLFKLWFQKCPTKPQLAPPSDRENVLQVGQEGETRFDNFISLKLDNSWTLLRGYKNYKGEIDRILVGPKGVFSFEIKNYVGSVFCIGDEWFRVKSGQSKGDEIKDKGGRGPAQQVNEPSDILQNQFNSNGYKVQIFRSVIFTNPKANVHSLRDVTVHFASTLRNLNMVRLYRLANTTLSPKECEEIVRIIETHHKA